MKAKTIMSSDVVTVSPSTGIREIYNIFRETHFGGLPVVDSSGKVLGMITKEEILAILLPDYFDMLGENIKYIDDFGALDKEFEQEPSFELFVAEDIMKKGAVSADENASLLKVAAIMIRYRVRRVIVEKGGILKGIITRGDLCKAFFEHQETKDL